jgi:hypothetical protein
MTVRSDLRTASEGGASVVDDATFRLLVELETRKAQRLRYWVSVVHMDVDGVSPDNEHHAASFVRRIARCLRATDAVTTRDHSSISALLVGAEAASLPTIVKRVTTGMESTNWSAGGSCYPATAASAHDLLEQARSMTAQAKRDKPHRLFMPS